MSDVYVSRSKLLKLEERMKELGLHDYDLVEKFVLGSGKGGQKVNKTSSCVVLRHIPSGITIRRHVSRSRAMNRFLARRELCDRITEGIEGEKSERRQKQEKIRRQKRRRSRRQKERILEAKRQQGEKKMFRKAVRADE